MNPYSSHPEDARGFEHYGWTFEQFEEQELPLRPHRANLRGPAAEVHRQENGGEHHVSQSPFESEPNHPLDGSMYTSDGIGNDIPQRSSRNTPGRLPGNEQGYPISSGGISLYLWRTMCASTTWTFARAMALFLSLSCVRCSREKFTEELLLRPLPNGHLMAYFHFQLAAERNDEPSQGFPHSIAHLAKAHVTLKDSQLRLTSGRWNYRKWGRPPQPASPVGAELVVNYVPVDEETDLALWQNLTHALGGLFCSSLSFLSDPSKHVRPVYFPIGGPFRERRATKYGVLPREAVCTENLTPWLKLLPCRDAAGKYDKDRISRNWALEEQLGTVEGPCPSSQSSHIYVQASKSLPGGADMKGGLSLEETAGFSLSPAASTVLDCEATDPSGGNGTISRSTLLDYPLLKYSKQKPLRLELVWQEDVKVWEPEWPLFIANSYLAHAIGDSGTIAYEFRRRTTVPILGNLMNKLQVCLFQSSPWFLRIWMHTLMLKIDGHPQGEEALAIFYKPSRDRLRSSLIELCFELPKTAKHALLTVDFDKVFLRRTEYPTDASRGEDVPAAVASVTEIYSENMTEVGKMDSTWKSIEAFPSLGRADEVAGRPLLQLLEKFPTHHIYMDGLMISMAIPDFSMPFNVCTFSSTVVAFGYTSLFVLLVRSKPSEEEEDKHKKLKKFLMIAGFGVLMSLAAAKDAGYF